MTRRRILAALGAVAAVAGVGGALALRRRPRTGRRAGPVVLLGLDGFEWRVALPMMREGQLPEMAALASAGVAGYIATLTPTTSPALWTTIATGRSIEDHGISDFLKSREPKQVLNTSLDRRCKAFWNILTEAGLSSVTVGWWLTYPVEPVKGLMVAQSNTVQAFQDRGIIKGGLETGLGNQVHPPERQAAFLEVARSVNERLPQIVDAFLAEAGVERSTLDTENLDESGWALRADSIYEKIVDDVLASGEKPDMLSLYFGLSDVVSHRFWKDGGPQDDDRHREYTGFIRGSALIPAAYRRADRAVGALRRRLPPDATILIVSDHGMRPNAHAMAPPAYFVASGPGIKASGFDPRTMHAGQMPTIGKIIDVLPTVLALLGVPAALDMPGKALPTVLLPEVIQARPPRVATYDDERWRASRKGGGAEDAEHDQERLEQLRNLGYIN